MTTLARQGHPVIDANTEQGADTKTRSGPHYDTRTVRLADAVTDRQVFIVSQTRHAQRHGAEVVDQQQIINFQLGGKRRLAEFPVAVGELEFIAVHRPGNRQTD